MDAINKAIASQEAARKAAYEASVAGVILVLTISYTLFVAQSSSSSNDRGVLTNTWRCNTSICCLRADDDKHNTDNTDNLDETILQDEFDDIAARDFDHDDDDDLDVNDSEPSGSFG